MFSSIGIFKEEIHLKVGEKRSQNNIKSKVRKKDKKYIFWLKSQHAFEKR